MCVSVRVCALILLNLLLKFRTVKDEAAQKAKEERGDGRWTEDGERQRQARRKKQGIA